MKCATLHSRGFIHLHVAPEFSLHADSSAQGLAICWIRAALPVCKNTCTHCQHSSCRTSTVFALTLSAVSQIRRLSPSPQRSESLQRLRGAGRPLPPPAPSRSGKPPSRRGPAASPAAAQPALQAAAPPQIYARRHCTCHHCEALMRPRNRSSKPPLPHKSMHDDIARVISAKQR